MNNACMQIQIKTELNIEKKKILKRCHFLLSYMLNSGELGGVISQYLYLLSALCMLDSGTLFCLPALYAQKEN